MKENRSVWVIVRMLGLLVCHFLILTDALLCFETSAVAFVTKLLYIGNKTNVGLLQA